MKHLWKKKGFACLLSMLLILSAFFMGCQEPVAESGSQAETSSSATVSTENFETESAAESENFELGSVTESENSVQDENSDDETQNDDEILTEESIEEFIEEQQDVLDEDGTYTSKEEVAAYLHQYKHLPSNFITKNEAIELGWNNKEGNLGEVAPGKSIGGDKFGNREGLLPKKDGRKYFECDINTDGSYRGAERIVYSNDGLIYYTGDHYDSFELLYGEE